MKKQGFNAMETNGAVDMWVVVRFLSDEEARETMEKELGQPAPRDIIDILITSRPIPGTKASDVLIERSKEVVAETKDDPKKETNTTTKERSDELMTTPGHAPEMEANEAPIEPSKEVMEEPENDLDKAANDDNDEVVQEGNTVTERRKELGMPPGEKLPTPSWK